MVVAIFSVSLVIPLLVAPAAAATCTLTAPATVVNGTPLAIVAGSGFPASTSVDISFTIEGGPRGELAVQSDADGAFQINLTQEEADAGTMTVVATAGAGCTAQVVFTVGGSGGVTPNPTDAPPGAGAGATSPPRTDAAATVHAPTTASPLTAWLVAGLMLVIGVGGLIATRPAQADSAGRRSLTR